MKMSQDISEKEDNLIEISPVSLKGTVEAMPSKSVTHRQMICSALCRTGKTAIRMREKLSRDMLATLDCLHELGADFSYEKNAWRIGAIGRIDGTREYAVNCGESGTTLRLLLPVLSALGIRARVTGEGRLPERPLEELCRALSEHGISLSACRLPLVCSGQLKSGRFELPGNVSSQYISGLLLALPLLDGDSELRLTTPLESAAYVALTRSVMKQFGVETKAVEQGWLIPGRQCYISPEDGVSGDGDWSNAAFFLAAGALGGPVTVTGLNLCSVQGDRKILDILKRFGAVIRSSGDAVTVSGGFLQGCDVDLREIPDLLPVLAVVAAAAGGRSRFLHGARLRLKESDRLAGVAALIQDLGGVCHESSDSLEIEGASLRGGLVQVCNDHRLVMAAALASQLCRTPVRFSGGRAIEKSYPDFFQDFQQTGGCCHGL